MKPATRNYCIDQQSPFGSYSSLLSPVHHAALSELERLKLVLTGGPLRSSVINSFVSNATDRRNQSKVK